MASRTRTKANEKPVGRPGRPRSREKRAAVIEAATAAFLERGYRGAGVDEIAAAARVSKQTVYEHFGGKEKLFEAVILDTVDTVGRPFWERIEALEPSDDPEAALGALARELVGVVREPRLLELRRVVIAEVARFPDLARVYEERGPGRSVAALTEVLGRLTRGGSLHIDDVELAAGQFNWLVLSIPVNRAMFAPGTTFTDAELERFASEAVRVFLAAYGRVKGVGVRAVASAAGREGTLPQQGLDLQRTLGRL
jgi:TetR/AcrR family transcriptional regulator, mexJK operon transcriptional repressor